jgi:hypothetical protein
VSLTAESVQMRDAFEHALKYYNPDLMFSDYSFPSFDEIKAFLIKQDQFTHIPLLLIRVYG